MEKQGGGYGADVEGSVIETLHPLKGFAALLGVMERVFDSMNRDSVLGEQQYNQAQYACGKISAVQVR